MLVLSRREEESIIIDDTIEIKIVGIKQDQVKIGIIAPKNVKIFRKEVYEEIQAANKAAAASSLPVEDLKHVLKKDKKPEGGQS
ncbi:MAG: carbon storage regulator CsrA [Brevinematales bacterium]